MGKTCKQIQLAKFFYNRRADVSISASVPMTLQMSHQNSLHMPFGEQASPGAFDEFRLSQQCRILALHSEFVDNYLLTSY